MSKAAIQTGRSRRWMLWLLSATALLIATVFAVLHFRAREWMRHVAVIESHGGSVYGYSNAPDWLLRLASYDSEYLEFSDTERIGPDWLRKYLPTDTILRCFETVERVELGHYSGQHVLSNVSGKSGDAKLDATVLRHLQAFPHLKELNLRGTEIDDSGLEGLQSLTSLRWLSLEKTSISNEGLKHLSKLTNLEELLLSRTEISDVGLNHLENLSRLRRLDLARTNVTDAGLASIGHLRKLEVLDLCSTDIRGKGLKELAPLQELKWLDLCGCANVSDVDFGKLAALTKLRFLLVSGEDLTVAGVKPLKRLKDLEAMELDFICPQANELRRELSTVNVSYGTLSLETGHYWDLLECLDDPTFDGGGLFATPTTGTLESMLESMSDGGFGGF